MAAPQLPSKLEYYLKGLYLQNKKVLKAQILSGLYWEYICFIGNVNIFIYNTIMLTANVIDNILKTILQEVDR